MVFSALANPFLLSQRLKKSAREGRITILNFHRVAPNDSSSYPPLEPALFDDVMAFIAKNFDTIGLAGLAARRRSTDRPCAVISFDDGYRDFVDHALPLLRRHGVRCNHNFIVSSLTSKLPPSNVLLQDFIGKAPENELTALATILGLARHPAESRFSYGTRASNHLRFRPMADQRIVMATIRKRLDVDRFATPMMSMADLKAVACEVEIGAHSYEHANLPVESDAYIARDAERCRDFFDQKLKISTPIYALPNGQGNKRVLDILRQFGFRSILLTGEQFARAGEDELPRFAMEGQSSSELQFRATGFVRERSTS